VRAVTLTDTIGVAGLESVELPDREVAAGRVLVRVRAAALNFADLLMCQGRYPAPPELPAVLGLEAAGDVVAVGGKTPFAVGDRVLGLASNGAFAELAELDPAATWTLPDSLTYAEGAALPVAFLTAYLTLVHQLRLRSGDVVLVHAAAGGVGTAAVQLAAHLGARVIATAGSAEKARVALELGADAAIDYSREDVVARVREETGGIGVDCILDPVGGSLFEASLQVVRPLGALVAIGYAGGPWPSLDVGTLAGRNVGVYGFYLARIMRFRPELVRDSMERVLELASAGVVRALIGAEFPLAETRQAHELLERRGAIGKVVVLP